MGPILKKKKIRSGYNASNFLKIEKKNINRPGTIASGFPKIKNKKLVRMQQFLHNRCIRLV